MANSHNTVAHAWAHQTGRNQRGFNMFYEGDTIYSYGYHFPIARFADAPNGERVVLFTSRGYSPSTAKHKTIVERALGYSRTDVLHVPNMSNMPLCHADLLREIEETAALWMRARTQKDRHARHIASLTATANKVNELWQLGRPALAIGSDIAAFIASSAERKIAEDKAQAEKDRDAIRKWVSGEPVNPPHTRVPYVRVKGDTVETSWGIKVPLAEAVKLHRMAGLVRIVGFDWHPKKLHKVGGWKVDQISYDGTIRAGCHVIPYKVSQEAARIAGLA